jgi:hypothetical protein
MEFGEGSNGMVLTQFFIDGIYIERMDSLLTWVPTPPSTFDSRCINPF